MRIRLITIYLIISTVHSIVPLPAQVFPPNARNVTSFKNPVRWSIYIINSVDKTKFSVLSAFDSTELSSSCACFPTPKMNHSDSVSTSTISKRHTFSKIYTQQLERHKRANQEKLLVPYQAITGELRLVISTLISTKQNGKFKFYSPNNILTKARHLFSQS